MTPERAREILSQRAMFGNVNVPRGATKGWLMTQAERRYVLRILCDMPGSASFDDALRRIEQGCV